MATTAETYTQSKRAKWGWGILLAVSAFLLLNGIGWFFLGGSLSTFETDTGVSLEEFRRAYPVVADAIAVNARQVAIWFMAIGILSLSMAWHGFRYGSRWIWNTMWVLVLAPAAVGLNVLLGEEIAYGSLILGLAVISLAGLLLARGELDS